MAQILLYDESVKFTGNALRDIRKAGIIPVKVNDFSKVKLLDIVPAFSAPTLDAITRSALEAIRKIDHGNPKDAFVRLLLKYLEESPQPQEQP